MCGVTADYSYSPPCNYLLLVAFACQHDKLHGVRDVSVCLSGAGLTGAPLLQLTLQLQRNGHVQLVHLHRLTAALLQGQNKLCFLLSFPLICFQCGSKRKHIVLKSDLTDINTALRPASK